MLHEKTRKKCGPTYGAQCVHKYVRTLEADVIDLDDVSFTYGRVM